MLNIAKLEALKAAALSSDWSSAGEAFIELGLGAVTAADRFQLETVGRAVRLFVMVDAVAALVDQILMDG